jgi:hypothetical protein
MNTRRFVLALLGLAGVLSAPAPAQIIHLSIEPDEAFVLFHTSNAGSPWDREVGLITKLDLYYDAESPLLGIRPDKNWWQMRVDVPWRDHSFLLKRPITSVYVWDRGMSFEFARHAAGVFEEFRFSLFFDDPIPTEGLLPIPPFPSLSEEDWGQSSFHVDAGRTLFPVADVTEVYGGGRITDYEVEILPVPEPSTYAAGAVVLAGVAMILRRTRRRVSSSG